MLVIKKAGSAYDIDYARTSVRVQTADQALNVVKDALENNRLDSSVRFTVGGQEVRLMTDADVEREFGLKTRL